MRKAGLEIARLCLFPSFDIPPFPGIKPHTAAILGYARTGVSVSRPMRAYTAVHGSVHPAASSGNALIKSLPKQPPKPVPLGIFPLPCRLQRHMLTHAFVFLSKITPVDQTAPGPFVISPYLKKSIVSPNMAITWDTTASIGYTFRKYSPVMRGYRNVGVTMTRGTTKSPHVRCGHSRGWPSRSECEERWAQDDRETRMTGCNAIAARTSRIDAD